MDKKLKSCFLYACARVIVLAGALAWAQGVSAETYYLLDKDPSGASSLDASGSGYAGWSTAPGGAKVANSVSAGNDYILPTDTRLRTKEKGDNVTFAGDSLIFEGGNLFVKLLTAKTITVNSLTVRAGMEGSIGHGTGSCTYTLAGSNWNVEQGATLTFMATSESGDARTFNIKPTISGSGDICCYMGSATTGSAAFNLNGDMRGHSGALVFDCTSSSKASKYSATVKTAAAFSGAMSAVTTDGVRLLNGVKLVFDCSLTNDASRGWCFGDTAPTIEVTAGNTVEIRGALSGTAGFKKTGAGTLTFTCDGLAEPLVFSSDDVTVTAAELAAYAARTATWAARATPPAFEILDSAKSDGTQFVALDFPIASDQKVDFVAKVWDPETGAHGVFGARGDPSVRSCIVLHDGVLNLAFDFANSDYTTHRCERSGTSKDVKFRATGTNKSKRLLNADTDGVYASNATADGATTPWQTPGAVYLYAINGVASTWKYAKAYVYSLKTYDANDALLHDVVPARRTADGRVGFYDRETKTFFEPTGKNPLVAGDVTDTIAAEAVDTAFGLSAAVLSDDGETLPEGHGNLPAESVGLAQEVPEGVRRRVAAEVGDG